MVHEPDPHLDTDEFLEAELDLESFCKVLGELVQVACDDRRLCRSWHTRGGAVRYNPGRVLRSGCDDRRVGESTDAEFRRRCVTRHLPNR